MRTLKRIVSIILVVAMSAGIALSASADSTAVSGDYGDSGYWAAEALQAAVDNGILYGKGNGDIDPTGYLTRAEMAAIMVRVFGASVSADVGMYSDLASGSWYYSDFAKAVHMKIFEGSSDGKMYPEKNITREEAFTVFARAMVLKSSQTSSLSKYKDADLVSSWAKEYMAPLAEKGYINGDNYGKVNPQSLITRAEFAQFIHNIFKTYISADGTYTKTGDGSVILKSKNVTVKNVTVNGDLVVGDGCGNGKVTIENVKIKGRLLVRGVAEIALIGSSVGEYVVVNNINSVVHFDNYREEKVFDGIVTNTEATFKEKTTVSRPTGGGGGSGSYNVYVVTFDPNGGSVSPALLTVTYNSAYGTLPTPTKTGYKFDGWYTALSGGTKVSETTIVSITANHTLYAHWSADEYTVTFDANGGTLSGSATKTVDYNSAYGALPGATRTGYTFLGWYDESVGGNKIEETTVVTKTSDHTLYAHWSVGGYTVTFDANGGTLSGSATKTVAYNSAYGALPGATRSGYTFIGWYDESVGGNKIEETTVVTKTSDHTLYAHWSAAEYTVTFDANGGTLSGSATKTVAYNSAYGTLPGASRLGHTFLGWYTALSGGTKVSDTTIVSATENHTLYAHWSVGGYTVTFDANGGTLSGSATKTVAYNSAYGALPSATRTGGYTFLGWYDESVGGNKIEETTIVTKTSDHTLYAHWSGDFYTVTFKDLGVVVKTENVVAGGKLDASLFPAATFAEGYKKNAAVSSILYPTEFVHKTKLGWWYLSGGKYVEFDENTVVNSDLEVELAPKQFKIQAYIAKVSDGITLEATYDKDTRFADTLKDLLWVNKSRVMNATSIVSAEDKIKEQLINRGVIDDSDNILIQELKVKFVDIIGESNLEKYIVDSAKDMFATNAELKDAIEEYITSLSTSAPAKAKSLIKEAVNYTISSSSGKAEICEILRTQLTNNHDFNDAVLDIIATYGAPIGASFIDDIDYYLDYDPSLCDRIVSEFTDLVITDASLISSLAGYAVNYVNSDSTKRDAIVDEIIKSKYRATLDKLLDELKNKEKFEINSENKFVAEGLKTRLLNEYKFDVIKTKIPAKLFEIYPEAKLREIYEAAFNDIITQIDSAVVSANSGAKAYVDTGFTFRVNPVADVYIPLQTRFTEIAEGKFGGNYYYADNPYLQELVRLTKWDSLFAYDASYLGGNRTGYRLCSVSDYYDFMLKITIIGDDAMIWYTNNLSSAQIDGLMNDYETLVLKYVNIVAKAAGDYANWGTIPPKADNKYVRAVEKAIKNKYPELVNRLIDKYKNSSLKDVYEHNDYTEYKNKVIKAFENTDLTAAEFFDKILADYYSKAKAEKISDDEYKISYKGNYINIRRVIEP